MKKIRSSKNQSHIYASTWLKLVIECDLSITEAATLYGAANVNLSHAEHKLYFKFIEKMLENASYFEENDEKEIYIDYFLRHQKDFLK